MKETVAEIEARARALWPYVELFPVNERFIKIACGKDGPELQIIYDPQSDAARAAAWLAIIRQGRMLQV